METPTGADFVDVDDIFHLEEAVGSGTFGTVIRARVRTALAGVGDSSSLLVALKKISLSNASNIHKEIDVLHTLKGHSNVTELLSCFLSEDKTTLSPSVYLVFNFFEARIM